MEKLFRKHPHAIERIQEIVERCNFSLKQLSYQFLNEYEGGETPMQKLERLTWEGAAFRYPQWRVGQDRPEHPQGVRP